jgi:LysR family transcriptional regulator of abg operon
VKLHQIRDFLAVAQAGGVRAAARELGLSQPAVSKSLQQLEADLGAPLFERSTTGAVLTAAGQAFLSRARAVTAELDRARDEVAQIQSAAPGTVAVAMTGTPAMHLLPTALRRFRRRHAQARVRVVERRYDATLQELREGLLDLAVMPQPAGPVDRRLVVEPILRDVAVVIARRQHPLRHAGSLEELLDAPWLVTRMRGDKAEEFENIFRRQKLRAPQTLLLCESVVGSLSLLAGADLLAYMPSRWLGSLLTRPLLERIPVGRPVEMVPICIVRRADLPLTPAAEALADAVRTEAGILDRALQI